VLVLNPTIQNENINKFAIVPQITSPACTELEVQVMNWFGKILELPKEFLNESEGPGGGVLQVFLKKINYLYP